VHVVSIRIGEWVGDREVSKIRNQYSRGRTRYISMTVPEVRDYYCITRRWHDTRQPDWRCPAQYRRRGFQWVESGECRTEINTCTSVLSTQSVASWLGIQGVTTAMSRWRRRGHDTSCIRHGVGAEMRLWSRMNQRARASASSFQPNSTTNTPSALWIHFLHQD
jgi:hypothetical protein